MISFCVGDVDQPVVLRMHDEQRTTVGGELLLVVKVPLHFGHDIIPNALAKGHRLFAYPFGQQVVESKAYWRDVGTLDAFWEANLACRKSARRR